MTGFKRAIQYVAKRVAKGYAEMKALCCLKSHMKFTCFSSVKKDASGSGSIKSGTCPGPSNNLRNLGLTHLPAGFLNAVNPGPAGSAEVFPAEWLPQYKCKETYARNRCSRIIQLDRITATLKPSPFFPIIFGSYLFFHSFI